MSMSNHERVGKALDLLKDSLGPFVEREMENVYQGKTKAKMVQILGEDPIFSKKPISEQDVSGLLRACLKI